MAERVLIEPAMAAFMTWLLLALHFRVKSRARLEAENIVLRQQVIVLSRWSAARVRLSDIDQLVLVWLYRLFPGQIYDTN